MSTTSLILMALAMSAGLAHAFELANKINLSREEYLIVQQLYKGWAWLGVVVVGAVAAMSILAVTNRNEPRIFGGALVALACVSASLAIFAIFTYPVNLATHNWTIAPDGWEGLRRRWEYSHAIGAGFDFAAFVTLVVTLTRGK